MFALKSIHHGTYKGDNLLFTNRQNFTSVINFTTIAITLMVVMQIFNPRHFYVTFPVKFDVYDINSNQQVKYSYSKIDIGPLKIRTGQIPEQNSLIENAKGQVKIEDINNAFLLVFLFILILFIAPVYYVLIQLKKFLNTVGGGNPFINENVVRFRRFGIIAIVLALLAGIAQFIAGFYAGSNIELPSNLSIVHSFDLNWELIFVGLILFVLAEAFKIGTSVKTENDLTI
jgi:hypothetical protein